MENEKKQEMLRWIAAVLGKYRFSRALRLEKSTKWLADATKDVFSIDKQLPAVDSRFGSSCIGIYLLPNGTIVQVIGYPSVHTVMRFDGFSVGPLGPLNKWYAEEECTALRKEVHSVESAAALLDAAVLAQIIENVPRLIEVDLSIQLDGFRSHVSGEVASIARYANDDSAFTRMLIPGVEKRLEEWRAKVADCEALLASLPNERFSSEVTHNTQAAV